MLLVSRRFTVHSGKPVVAVEETLKSLVGFERPLGRAQHVTFGNAFLRDCSTTFYCNADKGHTWPDPLGPLNAYATDVEFAYPDIPANHDDDKADVEERQVRGKRMRDWRVSPHKDMSEGLCTLRVAPENRWGWLSAHNSRWQRKLTYVWQRADFPWLMNWEENSCRSDKPWDGRTLTRGLEFSSYAYALGRQRNVEIGKLFDTPAFEWLDAHEEKTTTFFIEYKATDR